MYYVDVDVVDHSVKVSRGQPCHLESIDRLQLPGGKLGHKGHLPEKYLEGAFDNASLMIIQ